jgi:ATP synthase F1 complex assembly factor 2
MFGRAISTPFSVILRLSTGLDPWRLAAVEQLTYSGKSLLLALALSAGRLNLKEALVAVRLEEIIQSEEWGEVEAGHDLDGADIGSRVTSAILILDLLEFKA